MVLDSLQQVSGRGRSCRCVLVFLLFQALTLTAEAGTFQLPTTNDALLKEGAEDDFFTPTPGKTWSSGSFGCVRSQGYQLHEGIDIKAQERDRRGEPIDPVFSAAAGRVVYVNSKSGNSSYGNYVVVAHKIDRVEVFTLYAHLRAVKQGLRAGTELKGGDAIGVMGRTATYAIPRDRAHLHFEVGLLVNDRFDLWFQEAYKGSRNTHGKWNGMNLLGLDPVELLRQSHRDPSFNLLEHIREQEVFCKVLVRAHGFSWLQRYPMLVKRNERASREGAAAFEMWLTFNGIPITLIPRAPSEVPVKGDKVELLEVNEEAYKKGQCCKLVSKTSKGWVLGSKGKRLIDLLVY